MNTMETICSRKTIRSYTDENITADELNVILKAANASPVGIGIPPLTVPYIIQ